MKLGHTPPTRLVQAQKISAQLIQSVELLQLGQAELEGFLAVQAESNPFLEVRLPGAAGRMAATPGGESREMEAVADGPRLADHLRSQLGSRFRDPGDRRVALEIIGSIDEDGYLRRDLPDIAEAAGAAVARVEAILREVQRMDPPGIAARDLAECLRLQLADRGWLTEPMEQLLRHLDLLARHDYRRLSARCGVEAGEVLELAAKIRSLDPRPGRRFEQGMVPSVTPDVLVSIAPDGTFVTRLNGDALPRVLVDREYCSVVRAGRLDPAESRYVSGCIQSASWLARKLDQRARTILRVATEIVKRHRPFLQRGAGHLQPLTLQDVAEALGMHPSTVSRAVAGKYMLTHRGLFALGHFFVNSVPASEGRDDVSADAVRQGIRQLIENESGDEVLSDDAIVERLRQRGVSIARRTVAKYREAMNIPSSQQRRRLLQARSAAARRSGENAA